MDIKSCRFCRKAFRGFSALCPTCAEDLDKKYITVRNYLDKDRGANVMAVAKETGVDEKSILFLIREGRIALRGSDGVSINCMKCGTGIMSGRYCDKCKGDLVQELESTKSAMESSVKQAQRKVEATTANKSKIHILKD